MHSLDRRKFVSTVGTGAVGMFGMADKIFGQTEEHGGRHKIKPLKYPANALKGISEQVVKWHHAQHYAGYVKKRNAIEAQLAKLGPGTANFDPRLYSAIKRDESFNASGMILHEVYFDNLGGDGKPGSGAIEQAIQSSFGSIETWIADMTAIAGAATGWALLCFDPSDGRLHDYLVDQHQLGAVWAATPIVALDVFEHAYYHDYGPDRGKYLTVFFDNLHWGRVNERWG